MFSSVLSSSNGPWRILLLSILIFTLAACQSDESEETMAVSPSSDNTLPTASSAPESESETVTNTAVPSPTETAAPTNTPLPTPTPTPEPITIPQMDGSEAEVAPLPPASYSDLLQQGIDSGQWSEGEGLAQLLQYLTGEIGSDAIPRADEVLTASATGLIHRAAAFVADETTDPAQRAEVERLLATIAPGQEILDQISAPAPEESGVKPQRQGKPAPQAGAEECEDLAANGFDADEVAASETCYLYSEAQVNGQRYRVYYPASWQGEADKKALTDAALLALTDSAVTFSELGTVQDINAIFSLIPDPDDTAEKITNAVQSSFPLDEACPITVFPNSYQGDEDRFQQIVAHEVFHCVQDWTFSSPAPYATHKWWLEGSAEYFSNVVYPGVNYEHRLLGHFDRQSRNTALMDMDYENFIFFQYLGNVLGDAAVMDLLNSLASGGGGGAALASYAGMDAHFQAFVVQFLSTGVPDSGGGMIGVEHPAATGIESIDEELVEEFDVDQFVAARYGLKYEQEKRFLEEPIDDGNGRYSVVLSSQRRDPSAWSALPPEVRSACDDDVTYALALTTAQDSYTFKADITTVEEAECDPCLLGTWDIDPDSFEAFMTRLIQESGGQGQLPAGGAVQFEIGGHDYVQFNEKGEMLSQRDGFQITMSLPDSPALVVTINGHGQGTYSADGETLTIRALQQTTTDVTLTVAGEQLGASLTPDAGTYSFFGNTVAGPGMGDPDGPTQAEGSYVCSEDLLTITLPDVGPVDFNRVDKILPTPVPTPG